MRQNLVYTLLALGLFSLSYGSYTLFRNSNTSSQPPTPSPRSIAQVTPEPTVLSANTDFDTRENEIVKAISLREYDLLDKYLAEQVEVLQFSTGCCGTLFKEDVLAELDFLVGALPPWDFDQKNPNTLAIKETTDHQNSLVGISQNGFVVVVNFNSVGQIDELTMASSYRALLGFKN